MEHYRAAGLFSASVMWSWGGCQRSARCQTSWIWSVSMCTDLIQNGVSYSIWSNAEHQQSVRPPYMLTDWKCIVKQTYYIVYICLCFNVQSLLNVSEQIAVHPLIVIVVIKCLATALCLPQLLIATCVGWVTRYLLKHESNICDVVTEI